jgi:hypothetical protein
MQVEVNGCEPTLARLEELAPAAGFRVPCRGIPDGVDVEGIPDCAKEWRSGAAEATGSWWPCRV